MSIIRNNILAGASGNQGGYEIERSLRLNETDQAYLRKSDFGTPDSSTTFTFSAWVKRGNIGTDLSVAGSDSGSNAFTLFGFDSADKLVWRVRNSSQSDLTRLESEAVFRDPTAWYHVLLQRDSTQSTAADRAKLWVNGVQLTEFSTNNTDELNRTYTSDFLQDINIGRFQVNSSTRRYSDGYVAEYYYIDGTALDPSSFTETDPTTGQLIPKQYVGSFGTNGFYLNFSDNSNNTAATLGKDSSGNGNNFTPNNFSVTAGTGNDSLEDTPTNNWCTLNPLIAHSGTAGSYEEGNLRRKNSTNSSFAPGFSSIAVTSGKWYFECSGDTSIYVQVGFVDATEIASVSAGAGFFNPTRGWGYQSNGSIKGNNSSYTDSTPVAASTSGDIIGCAVDFDSGSAEWYVNGTQTGATLNFSSYLATGRAWHLGVAVTNAGTDIVDVNFGQRAFDISSIPTGFKALNTANLPVPTIKNGTEYFTPVLYTGNVTARDITVADNQDNSWQPDWVWIKGRTTTSSHVLTDSVRGATKILSTHNTNNESTDADTLTAFKSNGFSIGADVKVNTNNHTYVAWNWKESVDAGFDIVADTGTGAAKTVSHSLGVAPKMIIRKSRTSNTGHWYVYHYEAGASKAGILQLGNAFATATAWNSTEPTSSVFSVGSAVDENKLNDNFINYLFAEVENYSKFGSYEGNGSSDGVFVYTGFRPSFFLLKNMDRANTRWIIMDNARDPYNVAYHVLAPSSGIGEDTSTSYWLADFVSNGVKLRYGTASENEFNRTGDTYIYMAFAETPFKYANAR